MDQQKKLKESIIKRDTDKIERIIQSFEKSEVNASVPEHIFVRDFLPYFSGQKPLGDEPVVTTWIAIAGASGRSVDVLSETNEVLFTVPPIINTDVIDLLNKTEHGSFSELARDARLQGNRLPVLYDRTLTSGAETIFQKLDKRTETQGDKDWANILKRYNLTKQSESAKQTTDNREQLNMDDLEF